MQKHDTYKEAFARIKHAIDQHFFIEAIAIQEAIISDRLRSHLEYHKKLPKDDKFHSLLREWRALNGDGKKLTVSIDLPELLDLWREQRNNAIHGIVAKESHVDMFLENAESAAKIGLKLTRTLCDWHQKEIRRSRPTTRASKRK